MPLTGLIRLPTLLGENTWTEPGGRRAWTSCQSDVPNAILGFLAMDYYSQFCVVNAFQPAPIRERAFIDTYQLLCCLRAGELVRL